MENIGGGLGFRATLDIDDFSVSAQAMERRIKDFSNTAIEEVGGIDDSFKRMAENAGRYISYYLVGQGMQSLLSSIVQTRGQFQQLEIAFETMLGSSSKAQELMGQMIDTAAKTPFDLMGVAEGAKQLMAYGVSADKVNDTLVRLGNIASGLSIPLNDIVYLYGTTMVQGRLYAQDVRQFTGRGIPLVKELAEMYHKNVDEINAMVSAGKIGFADVEKVLNKMTDAGGQFYNLMEKQSSSLTGQIANLQDAWDTVLNDWGQAGEGLFSTAISSATYLVEHMDDVVRILKSVAIAYGTVKAAVVLNSVATKGYTGIAVIDNTVRSAKLALMKAEDVLTGTALAQKKAMTVAEEAHFQAMEATLTAEQQAAIVKQVRIAAIQSLLTAQQQEYLSNIGLTQSSIGYEAAAMGVLSADQRLALSKMDLTAKGAAYKAEVMQEVAAKNASQVASLESMRAMVKEAAVTVEAAKTKAIAANQAVEAARYEAYWAQQSGNATAIASAQKRLEVAVDQQKITRTAALAAQSDFYTKKKQLETLATQQGRAASVADTAAKTAQTAATNILSVATGKLSAGLKALWATMVANPIGAILSLVGLLISAFTMLSDSEEDAADGLNKFGESGEAQSANIRVLLSVLENTKKGSSAYKKAFDELNAALQEHGLEALDASASIDEIRKAYENLTVAIEKSASDSAFANSMAEVKEEYTKTLDEISKKIQKELKEAHHYNADWNLSFDSKDIQAKATALSSQIRNIIESAVEDMVVLPTEERAKAKEELREQITEILTDSGIDKAHAEFITDYSWLDDRFYDVFSGPGGIIDQVLDATEAFNNQMSVAGLAAQAIGKYTTQAEKVPEKVDLASMSIEQLADLLHQMEGANVTVDFREYGFDSLMSMINAVKSAISEKQNNLNTEEGIEAEMQRLTLERKQAEFGSQEWIDANNQYNQLKSRLEQATGKGRTGRSRSGGRSGRSTANDAARNAEALIKAQREADWKLEEARISTLEEGYEKRKAVLDLQLKQELQRIDDEEKAFEEARKKAGKGELTQDDKERYTQQRAYAQSNYNRDAAKLYDGELDYKRQQYELYWRWVENMGKKAADEQFASLLESGNSYIGYIEKQLADLNSKKDAGTISDAETQFMYSLNTTLAELKGDKSPLEAFKEDVADTMNRCETLAEKLEAIAEVKRKLESGETKLNADDRLQAHVEYSQQEAELQKELHATVLKDYRSFEEQRQVIAKEYAILRTEAEKMGDEERIKLINKAEQEALSALNTTFLQQSDSWKKLFSNLDTLSVGQIQQLVDDIESQLSAGDLVLSPVDYKALIDSLNQAKERIQELNPFAALDNYFDNYIAARKKLAAAKSALARGEGSEEDVEKAKREVIAAANGITASVEKVTEITTKCAQSLQSMFDALGMEGVADGIGTAIELMEELGNSAAAVGKFMAGDVVGGITGILSSITSVVGIFTKLHDKKYEKQIQELQKQIDALDRSYSRLERAFNNTYWVFTDEQRAGFEQNIQLIEDHIAALEKQRETAKKAWQFGQYAKLTAEIRELYRQLDEAKSGDDMLGLYDKQLEALEKQKELINEQIKAEESKKKTDDDKIQQWRDAMQDIDDQIADMQQTMIETFAGTSTKEALDQYADAIVDAYCAGEDAAKALGDTTREVLKQAVVDALKRNFLAKAMDEAVKYLGDAMSDGVLSDSEKAEFERLTQNAGEVFTNALEAVGDWIKDTDAISSTDPLTGAVTSMSEETGGVIAGRLNAFIINQTDQTNMLRQQLLTQSEIAKNTAAANTLLAEIDSTLRRIETKDSSLLSQGIS